MIGEHIPFPFIRKLMADKTEQEIIATEARFARVLLILKRIADREADSKPGPEGERQPGDRFGSADPG